MATIAEKLSKLETKIEKHKAIIQTETDKLNADLAEYDKLYLTALADKFKLKGKDLFSTIEREHDQLKKLRDGGISDSDIESLTDNSSSVKADENEHNGYLHGFTDEDLRHYSA